jgi:regulator of protease activity HflC (stomatin/prohibitin superfamily)
MSLIILIIVFLFAAFVYVACFVPVVKEGHVSVVERLGRFNRVLHPGVHFLIPFIDSTHVTKWIRTVEKNGVNKIEEVRLDNIPFKMELKYDPPAFRLVTGDGVSVKLNFVMTFQIVDVKAAIYNVEDLYGSLESLFQTTSQTQCFGIKSSEIADGKYIPGIIKDMKKETEKWGILLLTVCLQDVMYHEKVEEANLKLSAAKKQAEMQIITESALRESELLKARRLSEIEIEQTKRKNEVMLSCAEAEAKQMEIKAKAEADRSRIEWTNMAERKKVLDDLEYVHLENIKKSGLEAMMLHKLQSTAFSELGKSPNSKLIFVPKDATNFMGNIASIAAIQQSSLS